MELIYLFLKLNCKQDILSNSLPWNQPQPPNVAEQPHARSGVHWGSKEGYSPLTHRVTFEWQIGI